MKTIIFDMDGTLIDSGTIIADTINYVRGHFGLEAMQKEYLLEHVNNPNIHPPSFFYGCESYSPRHIELFETFYHEHYWQKIALYDGIAELLEYFSAKARLTVATNASSTTAKAMLQALNIEHYFEYIIGADCVAKPKPAPDMVLKTLQTLNVLPNHALLVGDSHKDMMAARSAGIEGILVNWGFSQFEEAFNKVSQLHLFLEERI